MTDERDTIESKESGFDPEFAEELEELEHYSHNEYVEVRVDNVSSIDDSEVEVRFEPPIGDKFTELMDFSPDPNEDTDFSELLRIT